MGDDIYAEWKTAGNRKTWSPLAVTQDGNISRPVEHVPNIDCRGQGGLSAASHIRVTID